MCDDDYFYSGSIGSVKVITETIQCGSINNSTYCYLNILKTTQLRIVQSHFGSGKFQYQFQFGFFQICPISTSGSVYPFSGNVQLLGLVRSLSSSLQFFSLGSVVFQLIIRFTSVLFQFYRCKSHSVQPCPHFVQFIIRFSLDLSTIKLSCHIQFVPHIWNYPAFVSESVWSVSGSIQLSYQIQLWS